MLFRALPPALVLALVAAQKPAKGSGEPGVPAETTGCYSGNGTDYEGGATSTVSGKPCRTWADSKVLTEPLYTELPQNFCRNPDGEPWPWCQYGPELGDYDQCAIPVCPSPPTPPPRSPPPSPPSPPSPPPYPPDKAPLPPPPSQPPPSPPPVGCYEGNGADYEGGAVLTVSGSLCQEWASSTLSWKAEVSEESYSYTYRPYNLLPENFCRNPDGESSPWCFTTNASLPENERRENCDIPVCPFPSPPPSPYAPPAAPPGLCTDTCNGQVGGAQVSICDDGVGRRDGVAGICEPGTDCSVCLGVFGGGDFFENKLILRIN